MSVAPSQPEPFLALFRRERARLNPQLEQSRSLAARRASMADQLDSLLQEPPDRSPFADLGDLMGQTPMGGLDVSQVNMKYPTRAVGEEPPGNALKEMGKGLARSAVRSVDAAVQTRAAAESAIHGATAWALGVPMPPGNSKTQQIARASSDFVGKMTTGKGPIAEDERLQGKTFAPTDPLWWSSRGGEAAGFLATMLIPGAAVTKGMQASGKIGSKVAGILAGASTSAMLETGLSRPEMREKLIGRGLTPEEADELSAYGAMGYGTVAGLLDVAPLSVMLGKLGGRSAVMRFLTGMAAESGTEELQEEAAIGTEKLLGINEPGGNMGRRAAAATLGATVGGPAAVAVTPESRGSGSARPGTLAPPAETAAGDPQALGSGLPSAAPATPSVGGIPSPTTAAIQPGQPSSFPSTTAVPQGQGLAAAAAAGIPPTPIAPATTTAPPSSIALEREPTSVASQESSDVEEAPIVPRPEEAQVPEAAEQVEATPFDPEYYLKGLDPNTPVTVIMPAALGLSDEGMTAGEVAERLAGLARTNAEAGVSRATEKHGSEGAALEAAGAKALTRALQEATSTPLPRKVVTNETASREEAPEPGVASEQAAPGALTPGRLRPGEMETIREMAGPEGKNLRPVNREGGAPDATPAKSTPERRGIVLLDPGVKASVAFMRRNLTSAGDLPSPVFRRKLERDAWTNSLLTQARYTLRDFGKAAKQSYGRKKLSLPEQQSIDAVLRGEADEATIPEPMRPVVARMRSEIDALSRRTIDSGAVEGDLAAQVSENMGVYLTRSYRAFDDPKWAAKVPVEIRNKAKALLRSEYPGKSDAEIDGLIAALLYEGKAAESPIAMLKRGKLGSKDLSILKRRKGISPEIRALWGEYEDPRQNFARSVAKMAHLIGNHQFLADVRAAGLGTFFHEQPIVKDGVEYKTRIAADESDTMHPLNGLYTSPEIKRAFEEVMSPKDWGWWFRQYMKVNGAVKYAKTVASVMTHVRNVISNTGFAIANAHWRIGASGKAIKTVLTDIGAMDAPKWRDFYRKMLDLGVVAESPYANELHQAIKDASKKSVDEMLDVSASTLPRKVAGAFTAAYRAEDDVWKIYAFENEMARYRKAMPEKAIDELERHVAEIVRNTYPTYSLVPRGVKALRMSPIVGTFVSFPAEVVRTGYHTIRLAAHELADPKLRVIGAQRMAGIMTASSGIYAAAAASRMLLGMTRDDDEDARRFVPPWSRNSQLLWLGRDGDGNLLYIDGGYSDPYSYLRKPIMAFLRGDDWETSLWEAGKEAALPFFGEELLFGKGVDVLRNKTAQGRDIWNPQDTLPNKAAAMMTHIGEAFEPGTISSARRVAKGLRGHVDPHGRSYDATTESLAVFTGQRIVKLDVRQGLTFNARRFNRNIADASSLLTQVVTRRGTVSASEIISARDASDQARRNLFAEMKKDFDAAVALGVTPTEAGRILVDAGLSAESAWLVRTGGYEPYQASRAMFGRIAEASREVGEKEKRDWHVVFRERRSAMDTGTVSPAPSR